MTTQVRDSLSIDGKKFEIHEWDGDFECIPSSASLGFKTVCVNTNNWRGRIDHFLVNENKLVLFKIEVNLHPSNKDILPPGARREIVQRYDPIEHWDKNGMRMIQKLRQKEYLIFDDLPIPFTGSLILADPYLDYWEFPWPIPDDVDENQSFAEAIFEEGHLVGWVD